MSPLCGPWDLIFILKFWGQFYVHTLRILFSSLDLLKWKDPNVVSKLERWVPSLFDEGFGAGAYKRFGRDESPFVLIRVIT